VSDRRLLFLVVAVAGLLAAGHPAIPAEANPTDAPDLRFEPQAPTLTSFELKGRIKITNRDVSFEVPADYQESFSFWTQRMKGIVKEEKVEYITVTRDRAEDGSVPFRRLIPRYELEILKPGMHPAILPKHIRRAVTSKVWEGTLDRYGNVIAMEETAGEEDDSIKELSFPFLDHLFPHVDGPMDIKIGEGFTARTKADLPTRLTINGLEDTGLILTRTYKLKEVGPEKATFGMKIGFEVDPDRPPTLERTTCVISGSGAGELDFDLKRGVFTRSKVGGTVTIDIEAPLRKLPDQAEDFDPGVGSTRVVFNVQMVGEQTVTKLLGEAEEPAPAAN
jgi:hypothetical protein